MSINMNDAQRMIELDDQIKALKKEQEKIKDNLKQDMTAQGTDSVQVGNRTITLTHTERVTMKDKDGFIKFLAGKGLATSCVTVEYVPNKDRIDIAVQQGDLAKAEVDKFIKVSEVLTMKVK